MYKGPEGGPKVADLLEEFGRVKARQDSPGPPQDPKARRVSRLLGVVRGGLVTRWYAQVRHEGRTLCLGSFATEEAAGLARDVEVYRLRGPGARLNFPGAFPPAGQPLGGPPDVQPGSAATGPGSADRAPEARDGPGPDVPIRGDQLAGGPGVDGLREGVRRGPGAEGGPEDLGGESAMIPDGSQHYAVIDPTSEDHAENLIDLGSDAFVVESPEPRQAGRLGLVYFASIPHLSPMQLFRFAVRHARAGGIRYREALEDITEGSGIAVQAEGVLICSDPDEGREHWADRRMP